MPAKTPTPNSEPEAAPAAEAQPEETSPADELAARVAARRADDRTILERMLDVAREVGPIGKDARNVDSGYAARGIDDVLTKIHYALVTNGVVLLPELGEVRRRDGIPTRSGGTQAEAVVRIRYRFIGAVAEDEIAVEWEGEALDSADKSLNKAASACLKYAFLQTFTIPLYGPENDADTRTPERGSEPEPDFDSAPKELLDRIVATVKELRALGVEVDAQGWTVLGVQLVANRRAQVDEVTAEGVLARLELLRPPPPVEEGKPETDHAADAEEAAEEAKVAAVDGFLGQDLPEGAAQEPSTDSPVQPSPEDAGGQEAAQEPAEEGPPRCPRCGRALTTENPLRNTAAESGQPVEVGCLGCHDEPAPPAEAVADAADPTPKPDKG